jgi:predicted ATPase
VKLRRERVFSFDQYPFSLPAVRNLSTLDLHPAVTFIVGENGSGKSTLLEAIAVDRSIFAHETVGWRTNTSSLSRSKRKSSRRGATRRRNKSVPFIRHLAAA